MHKRPTRHKRVMKVGRGRKYRKAVIINKNIRRTRDDTMPLSHGRCKFCGSSKVETAIGGSGKIVSKYCTACGSTL